MSTAPTGAEKKESVKKPLLGKNERKVLSDPLWDNNPITLQVLGICSSLAVTTQVKTALVMSLAVISVLTFSNLIISMVRNFIPSKIRIIVMLTIVASLVIFVDELLKAFMFDISKQLSVFVGLIITNCILLGRAEGFASQNKVWPSTLDGLGNGMGYGIILILVSIGREFLGNGSLFGIPMIPESFYEMGYRNMGLMILPPGAFLILGLIIWIQRTISGTTEEA